MPDPGVEPLTESPFVTYAEYVLAEDDPQPDTLAYDAWVLLANGAYWDHTDPQGIAEWNACRDRWRDRFHADLDRESSDE